ncbi:MAG: hypothetical protein CR982_08250 [Candidatus Cloacimonadota bacterium]|nr:MAG: hypothetical protein CR982_08250 [Candidatus Cloacimonadota bacterium]
MKQLFNIIKRILLLFITLFIIFFIVVVSYINLHPTFGGVPNEESKTRIEKSSHFDGEHFANLVETDATSIGKSEGKREINRWALFKNFIFPPKGKNPEKIKTIPLKSDELKNGQFIWLGHSTVLFKTNNTTIITDPVFNNAAPVPFFIQPFDMSDKPKIEDLPFIDVVLISHDHYDHLDYKAIQEIDSKVGHFCVPLGVKAHLLRWGVSNNKISEYDWYENREINNINFVFTPSRHFSGRGIFNHRKTLWGSWSVISPDIKIYFSGDGGYSPEFKKIGEKFNGFDIAFMENGAYNKSWEEIHMFPEQSAQASIDIKTKVVLPIHWGKFDLSTHRWNEPVERIKKAIQKHNETIEEYLKIKLATPRIGEVFSIDSLPISQWWEEENN